MGSYRRHVALAVLAIGFVGSNPALAQTSPDAKAALADGDRAAKSKDWTTAARFYENANKAAPSAEALEGAANAYYSGGHLGDAHAAYTDWLARYGATAAAAKKTQAEARVKELVAKTGAVTLTVSEPGATILVDDRPAGTSPLAQPLRAANGTRKIKVTKDGFAPFEQSVNVSTSGPSTVTVNLVGTSAKGKITVKEQGGKAVRILVDGVDMGDAPWTGDVEPGPHEISLRAMGLAAAPQRITVERGRSQELTLVASNASAPVKLGTNDGKGLVYLDDKVVGEGTFSGDVPAGAHKLKITRDGYDTFEEDILVKDKEPYSRTVTLKINNVVTTGEVKEFERFDGVFGGFTLAPLWTPGGTGSSIQSDCAAKATPTLASCETPSGFGGGVGGYVGYSWDPVGIEFYGALQYDQRTLKNDWNAASTDPGFGPDPARFEAFHIRRIGGMGIARVRLQYHPKPWLRLSFAGGAGISYRAMHLERNTTSKAASEADVQRDTFSSNSVGYWSPVVSLEPSVSYRVTRTMAVQVGMQIFLDAPATFLNGKNNPSTNAEGNHALGARGLATPSYQLASDMQVFIGPFVGMQFGP